MKKNLLWIVVRVDGRIASVSLDYRALARVADALARLRPEETGTVTTEKISSEALASLSSQTRWEDLAVFGTPFQKEVWKTLFDLTHPASDELKLLSYSEFAALCGNPDGVRAVAHAVAQNPIAYIIPCHLIIPKESIDKAAAIRADAQKTLFKGADLDLLTTIDCGEYGPGKSLKKEMIALQFGK